MGESCSKYRRKKLRQINDCLYLKRKCNSTLRVNASPSHNIRIRDVLCLRSKFKNCAVFAVKLSVGICYRNFFCIAPAGISVIIGTIKILMNHESFSFIAAKNCKQA